MTSLFGLGPTSLLHPAYQGMDGPKDLPLKAPFNIAEFILSNPFSRQSFTYDFGGPTRGPTKRRGDMPIPIKWILLSLIIGFNALCFKKLKAYASSVNNPSLAWKTISNLTPRQAISAAFLGLALLKTVNRLYLKSVLSVLDRQQNRLQKFEQANTRLKEKNESLRSKNITLEARNNTFVTEKLSLNAKISFLERTNLGQKWAVSRLNSEISRLEIQGRSSRDTINTLKRTIASLKQGRHPYFSTFSRAASSSSSQSNQNTDAKWALASTADMQKFKKEYLDSLIKKKDRQALKKIVDANLTSESPLRPLFEQGVDALVNGTKLNFSKKDSIRIHPDRFNNASYKPILALLANKVYAIIDRSESRSTGFRPKSPPREEPVFDDY